MPRPPFEPTEGHTGSTTTTDRGRRRFLAACGGVGTVLLAGCAGRVSPGDLSGSATGGFRLLVSDRPADIGDFDSLTVTFDRARIFRADEGGADDDDGTEEAEADSTATTDTPDETERPSESTDVATETDAAAAEDDDDDGDSPGWSTMDLSGESADLTQLVGERAQPIFEGDLPEGRYTKVELSVADVEGIVEGEAVDVFVPSGKLQLTKPFTVTAGETTTYVFDINVVRKGQGGYNLTPVISESGVAGEDVPVTEVPSTTDGNATDTDAGSPTATEPTATDSSG